MEVQELSCYIIIWLDTIFISYYNTGFNKIIAEIWKQIVTKLLNLESLEITYVIPHFKVYSTPNTDIQYQNSTYVQEKYIWCWA